MLSYAPGSAGAASEVRIARKGIETSEKVMAELGIEGISPAHVRRSAPR